MLIFQALFENVCEFSYKGARQKLLYAISHTKNVCDFSYMMDDEPGLRPAFCGVPAAGCRGGEGQAEMRPFTNGKAANLRRSRRESAGRGRGLFRPVVHNFKENRRWHTLFKNLVNFSHRKFCTFWTKISFFKNFEKILRFLKIKNWRSFWHFFQILKIPPFILIYKKGHKGAWHICSAAAAQRRRKCGRLRRPPAAATLRHPSLRSGPLWNHMWTLVSAFFYT